MKSSQLIFTATVLILQALSTPALASIDDEFSRLKDLGENYEISGVVCEQIALFNYQELYPAPTYEVVSGVAYGDDDGTLGELDIVVFESKSGTAQTIAEVKCWEDNRAAMKTAKEQQARFKRSVQSGEPLYFNSTKKSKRIFESELFRKVRFYETVAPLHSKADGFDHEIPYSLTELSELRSRLLQCQAAGDCKKR